MKVIDNIQEWVDYISDLARYKKAYSVNEPEEFPCIVLSSFRKKIRIDDETHEKQKHRFYEHKFIYKRQAEKLMQYADN